MPFKSDTMRLVGLADRRRKLTDAQRAVIRAIPMSISGTKIAMEYGVSRSLIEIIRNPMRAERVHNRTAAHWRDYMKPREETNEIVREHRLYKHGLYLAHDSGIVA